MVIARDLENITEEPNTDSHEEFLAYHWKRKMYWARPSPNLHSVLAFIFDVEPRTMPARMTTKAIITSDEHIQCGVIDPHGRSHSGAYVTSMSDLEKQMVYWANQLKLTAEEKAELTDLLNDWVATNYSGRRFKIV